MRKRNYPWFFILLLLSLILQGCKNPQDRLVGTWEDTSGGQQTYQFNQDGKIIFTLLHTPVEGKYSWIDENTIRLELPTVLGGTTTDDYDVSFNGDNLILTSAGVSIYFKLISP